MKRPGESDLEHLIDRTLRDLPPLRAPAGLSDRVLAELERRASLPWWRRSFRHWPAPARGLFVVLAASVAWAASAGLGWAAGRVSVAGLAGEVLTLVRVLGDALGLAWQHVPSAWVQAAFLLLAALAAGCLGLGAAGYRAVHAGR